MMKGCVRRHQRVWPDMEILIKHRSGFVLAACAIFAACGGSTSEEDALDRNALDRSAFLRDTAALTIVPSTASAQAAALELAQITSKHAEESRNTSPASVQAHRDAQQAWKKAMDEWQRLEMLQMGPAGDPAVFKGGQGLRDEVYSWPVTSPCKIDQEIVAGRFQQDDFFRTKLVDVYGLDAIEYLLFSQDAQPACRVDGWDELGAGEIGLRRAQYAAAAAKQVRTEVDRIATAWSPEQGNFAAAFAVPNEVDSPYADQRCSTDELFAALYYLESVVKDVKLAVPAGISPECTETTCTEAVESAWSGHSKENILTNLRTFQNVLRGGVDNGGVGFEELLASVNATPLAEELADRTQQTLETTSAIPGTLQEALASNPETVRDAHAAIKDLTDLVKTQFVSVLNLRVPGEGAADND